ncbi:MAG: mechanosensitive ion channel family protein [Promethearchaeota archaeon]
MAIFETDWQALIFLIILIAILYLLNKIVFRFLEKSSRIPLKQKILASFALRILTVLVIIYFIIEGFPLFLVIPEEYRSILTGAISTAIAFASSGIFANLVSGIVLMLIRPFDVGDLVKLEKDKGIIRAIGLTKILLETFDNVFIEKSNQQLLSTNIVNYTVKLGKKKSFEDFKRKVIAPQDQNLLDIAEESEESILNIEKELKQAYDTFKSRYYPNLYNFTFRMAFPYRGFKLMIEEVEKLCESYRSNGIFRIKPKFDIVNFTQSIFVKFRILTFDSEKIFKYQPVIAKEIFDIIYRVSKKNETCL